MKWILICLIVVSVAHGQEWNEAEYYSRMNKANLYLVSGQVSIGTGIVSLISANGWKKVVDGYNKDIDFWRGEGYQVGELEGIRDGYDKTQNQLQVAGFVMIGIGVICEMNAALNHQEAQKMLRLRLSTTQDHASLGITLNL